MSEQEQATNSAPTAEAKPAKTEKSAEPLKTSKQMASVGRVVHAYCPRLWSGPRPAVVVNGPWGGGDHQMVNCNVMVDGVNEQRALAIIKGATTGNTLLSIELFDALTDAQRAEAALAAQESNQFARDNHPGDTYRMWAEWPPRV